MSQVSLGIVGLPNVGKSTLFNSLTNAGALVANYPFATIEPNVGIVSVPDKRLSVLGQMYKTEKILPATVRFVDIAGLVAGASQGEGLGNQFLSHIRTCQAIIQVVRDFKDTNVTHVDDKLDPKKDIDTINTELVLADLQTIDKRLAATEKEAKANPKLRPVIETYQTAKKMLDQGLLLNQISEEEKEQLSDLGLITVKPMLYVFNVDEDELEDTQLQNNLAELVSPIKCLFVCAKLELELSELDDKDQQELLESYGQKEPGLNKLIDASYNILGLQSFLTAGPKEVRAWTISKGMLAPQAAGVIHTDFEKGFIAAEVVDYNDLVKAETFANAKSMGKVRTEGKTYELKKDDVVEFRFNVS
jgi:GTP-binding protein YchF